MLGKRRPSTGGRSAILEIEQKGTMLILKSLSDLHDFDEIEGAGGELSKQMDHSEVTDVFLDLHGTNVLRSHAPQLAVELGKRVRSHGGSMAIGLI
jgi:hypothetical protein